MAEAATLKKQKSAKQAELSQCVSDKASIEEKLERLRTAKKEVASVQTEIKDLKSKVKDKSDQPDTWQGKKLTEFENLMEGAFKTDYDTYYKKIDNYYDEICDEITRLENEANEKGGLIGWLGNQINNLGNEIDKLVHH
ncbi:DUF5082 domain-containing protein [Listeria fleischmannii]|uniref:DUF5082 domain-containing protein n=1 Tax=Listeria fleischmannii TaxID=1069827 RepID=A0A841YCS2_9LIST|nr:DUF5082 domain-containing protein [Listeria fleischmannii]MBC1397988.1 DUF5082 domain-containing protein [Listeria fleischmannii]MBC1426049.1 DUF5082 domain-containing protein [Listeria fleischmannii]STY34322.1 Uncharacterised protein [Listeria fleischmannii subsp. coloradonensis]